MTTLLEDLVQWIVDNGLCEGDGIDIFRDYLPDIPDKLICLIEYDSNLPTTKFNQSCVYYIQVVCRDIIASGALRKATQIFNLFHQVNENVTDLPNGRWALIYPRQAPFKIDEDEKRRVYYGFNVVITTSVN